MDSEPLSCNDPVVFMLCLRFSSPVFIKVHSLSHMSSSSSAAVSLCSFWRPPWVSSPVREASLAGGKSAHCLRVRRVGVAVLQMFFFPPLILTQSFIFTHWLLQLCRWSITSHCRPSPGIGYATQVIEAHLNVYYVVILAWAIFYLFNCFTTELPWAGCGHYWNTGRRRERLIWQENLKITEK